MGTPLSNGLFALVEPCTPAKRRRFENHHVGHNNLLASCPIHHPYEAVRRIVPLAEFRFIEMPARYRSFEPASNVRQIVGGVPQSSLSFHLD